MDVTLLSLGAERSLASHADAAIEREFFGGWVRIVRWWQSGGKFWQRGGCWRYSLIVRDQVEVIGAFSPREAVTVARKNRAFFVEQNLRAQASASDGETAADTAPEAPPN